LLRIFIKIFNAFISFNKLNYILDSFLSGDKSSVAFGYISSMKRKNPLLRLKRGLNKSGIEIVN
jgi:hypothetical protein